MCVCVCVCVCLCVCDVIKMAEVAGEDQQFFRFVGPPLVRNTLLPHVHPLGTLELAVGSDRSTLTASRGYGGRSTWRALTARVTAMAPMQLPLTPGLSGVDLASPPYDSFLAYKTGPKLLPGSCPTPLLGQGVPRRRRCVCACVCVPACTCASIQESKCIQERMNSDSQQQGAVHCTPHVTDVDSSSELKSLRLCSAVRIYNYINYLSACVNDSSECSNNIFDCCL